MLRVICSIALAFLVIFQSVPTKANSQTCVTTPGDNENYDYYLPLIMANISAFENIENLVRQPADFPFDGWALEVFPETITVRLVGTNQIKRSVMIPDHIPSEKIKKGVPVRLGEHMGQPILLAILPQLQNEVNYSGKGTVIPNPPAISVVAIQDGWLITWAAVPGADRYQVYRNDTADETSPDEVGYVSGLSITVPYESPFIYFAVRSISGLNQSQLSGWLTDNTPPPVPTTFQAFSDVDGHRLTISEGDAALTHQGFKCFEVEIANDSGGTGAVSLGLFFLSDFPNFQPFGAGTVKYYRIRSVDWAGNTSAWTAWDYAYSQIAQIEDKFDGYGSQRPDPMDSLYWLQLLNMEEPIASTFTVGQWLNSEISTTHATALLIDGASSLASTSDSGGYGSSYYWQSGGAGEYLDLSNDQRFGDDDYLLLVVDIPDDVYDLYFAYLQIRLYSPNGNAVRTLYRDDDNILDGINYIAIRRGDIEVSPGFDWSEISSFEFSVYAPDDGTPKTVRFDDLRIVKADPDNPAIHNDTGDKWDIATNTGTDAGIWHIYPGNRAGEPGKPFSYGQIKTATSPSIWYLSHKPIETTQIDTGTVQSGVYIKGIDGQAGIAFFITDVTPGSWDMYAVEVDTAANQIRLVRWVAGTRTQISAVDFTSNPDTLLWLGVDLREYDAGGGRLKVFASYNEGNLIQAANMIISAQDTTLGSGGSVGVLSYQANARFVNFVAGSPEHAAVADVARALDGPILGPLVFPLGGELTIASGIIQVIQSFHTVDTEADAASDDLTTINGGVDGMTLILQAADSARTVVCKDATGNLSLAGDMSLDNAADTITLFRRGGTWYELARSSNAA